LLSSIRSTHTSFDEVGSDHVVAFTGKVIFEAYLEFLSTDIVGMPPSKG
jgi:hypothetical protein